jgi:hypothetical protein
MGFPKAGGYHGAMKPGRRISIKDFRRQKTLPADVNVAELGRDAALGKQLDTEAQAAGLSRRSSIRT